MNTPSVQVGKPEQVPTAALKIHQISVDIGSGKSISVDLCVPEIKPAASRVIYCMPGGGMSKKYFDLGGASKPDYSFLRFFAARGYVVVSVDPIGVGQSTRPDDSYALTAKMVVDDYALTITAMRQKFKQGMHDIGVASFTPSLELGVGHSMGAMLTVLTQTNHELFDAVGVLGFGTKGLPQMMSESEQAVAHDMNLVHQRLPEFARKRFHDMQYPRIPNAHHDASEATDVLKEAADVLLPLPAALSMFPGNIAVEVAALRCPVFIGVGDRDMAGEPNDLPGEYQNSPHVTLYVIEQCGHHGFVARDRTQFFSVMLDWANAQRN